MPMRACKVCRPSRNLWDKGYGLGSERRRARALCALGQYPAVSETSVPKARFHPHARRNEDGTPRPRNQWVDVEYSIAARIDPDEFDAEGDEGLIVLTGKPQKGAKPSHKKQEFFFYAFGNDNRALVVDDHVFRDFKEIHEPSDGRDCNPNWQYWKDKPIRNPILGTNQYIPVFYITENGRVSSFGLSMMFKLAHELSTHDMIDSCSTKHLGAKRQDGKRDNRSLDFATALFGDAAQEPSDGWGLKGRVSFDFAVGPKADQNRLTRHETMLMGPKPSYYPTYVQQPEDPVRPGYLPKNNDRPIDFASYTRINQKSLPAELSAAQKTSITKLFQSPQLNGNKRYPVHFDIAVPVAPPTANPDQRTVIWPIKATADVPIVFVTRMRFHNLLPIELGALVWALTWGADARLRHSLGMGKPYGLGRTKIEIIDGYAIPNKT